MSKIDKIKEQISWFKVIFGILSAIAISLIGFLATSYDKAEPITLILALAALLAALGGIIPSDRPVLKRVEEL